MLRCRNEPKKTGGTEQTAADLPDRSNEPPPQSEERPAQSGAPETTRDVILDVISDAIDVVVSVITSIADD